MNIHKRWRVCIPLLIVCLGFSILINCGGGSRTNAPLGHSLKIPRIFPSATRLKDGRILVVGGATNTSGGVSTCLSSVEIVDPGTGSAFLTGSMAQPRQWHTATLLPDGRVLVTGGSPGTGNPIALDGAELFDPATGRFQPTGSLNFPRHSHTATLMKDGRVLITGGDGPTPDQVWSTTEIYDPGTGLFQIASGMTHSRTEHAACLLASGEVLVAGGIDWSTTANMLDVEVYDPVSGKYRLLSKLLPNYMVLASFLDLPSGKVFLADAFGGVVLDPVTLTCGPLVPALETRSYSAWVPWPGGALVIGGYNPANPGACYANGEHFVEMENRFKPATFRLSHPRMGHVAVNLDDVTVLVIGGNGSDGLPLSEMEWIKP